MELVLLTLAMLTIAIVAVVVSSIQPMASALAGKMAQLVGVLFFQLAAHLAICLCSNLFEVMALQASIVLMSLVDQLKVLCKSLEHLVM
jgi:hypothetical protein